MGFARDRKDFPNDKYEGTIAVDFDRTIHSYHDGYKDGRIYGYPLPGVRDALKGFVRQGFNVAIYTARLCYYAWPDPMDRDDTRFRIVQWLEHHDLSFKIAWHSIVGSKIPADVYIDDKALHHVDWTRTLHELLARGIINKMPEKTE